MRFLYSYRVECKPPKSLNRMRSKGTYNAAAFNSPSMINNGLLLAVSGVKKENKSEYSGGFHKRYRPIVFCANLTSQRPYCFSN